MRSTDKQVPNRDESPSGSNRERDIFLQAIEIADQTLRRDFLVSACGDDKELLNGVLTLIARHESDSDLIVDRPLFPDPLGAGSHGETRETGVCFGPYELQKRLGEGGMGEVWLATQREPVQRKVALKLVRTGRETAGVLQRFEAERQALAVLDHPNIARVIDAGETPRGLPFFVMELVEGQPLSEYCDRNRLTIKQRLQIFIQIANAVSHAHQKAILHRDLKPSNVLVTEVDGKPVPKVIDFGLAKALTGTLTPDPTATRAGDIVGTLEYMAPEQAGFRDQDIDTRADVYSLGVLLYELLTGLRPFDSKQLQEAALDEALRIVKEDDPVIPSQRLSSSGSAESFAELRRTESSRLRSLLKDELDWIVMKAIEKDRDRRYQSAGEFADDINRYLNGEPVEAHPPSRSYRIRKFISKNRGLATSVAAVTIALLAGIAGTSYGLFTANAATEVAVREKADAEAARIKAVAAAVEEERQKRFAFGITDFLKEDILELTSAEGRVLDEANSPGNEDAIGLDATLGDLLDRAKERLLKRKDLDPLIKAELCLTIGRCYRRNGDADSGIPLLRNALEIFQKSKGYENEYRTTRNSLTAAYLDELKLDEAKALIDETIEQPISGTENDLQISHGFLSLAEYYTHKGNPKKAVESARKSLELARSWGQPTDVLRGVTEKLGADLCQAGKFEEGLRFLRETASLSAELISENHPETLKARMSLAVALRQSGDAHAAVEIFDELLPVLKETIGPDTRITLDAMSSMATAYAYAGQLEKARELGNETLKLTTAKFGPGDRSLISNLIFVALIEGQTGKFDGAVPLLEQAVEISTKIYTREHPDTLSCMDRLANTYSFVGRFDEAAKLFDETLNARLKVLGDTHPSTWKTFYRLAYVLQKQGKYDRAIELLGTRYEKTCEDKGENNKNSLQGKSDLSAVEGMRFLNKGEFKVAEAKLIEAVNLRRQSTPGNFLEYRYRSILGECEINLEKYAEAKESLETAEVGLRKMLRRLPDGKWLLNKTLDRLIQLAKATGDQASLEKWQAEKDALDD